MREGGREGKGRQKSFAAFESISEMWLCCPAADVQWRFIQMMIQFYTTAQETTLFPLSSLFLQAPASLLSLHFHGSLRHSCTVIPIPNSRSDADLTHAIFSRELNRDLIRRRRPRRFLFKSLPPLPLSFPDYSFSRETDQRFSSFLLPSFPPSFLITGLFAWSHEN